MAARQHKKRLLNRQLKILLLWLTISATHERIENKKVPGIRFVLNNVLPKPVEIYFENQEFENDQMDLLIHFHGASYVPEYAVHHSKHPLILAVVNLGSGSSVYEKPFQSESVFPGLIKSIIDSVSKRKSTKIKNSPDFP